MRSRNHRLIVGIAAAIVAGWSAAHAGTVQVSDAAGSATIVVVANDSSVVEILQRISAARGIALEGVDAAGLAATPRSGRWQGTLEDVLARLLRQQNYILTGDGASRRLVLVGQGGATSGHRTATRGTVVPDDAPQQTASANGPPTDSSGQVVAAAPSLAAQRPVANAAQESSPAAKPQPEPAPPGPGQPFAPHWLGPDQDSPAPAGAMTKPSPTPTELVQHFNQDIAALIARSAGGLGQVRGIFDGACRQSRSFCN